MTRCTCDLIDPSMGLCSIVCFSGFDHLNAVQASSRYEESFVTFPEPIYSIPHVIVGVVGQHHGPFTYLYIELCVSRVSAL